MTNTYTEATGGRSSDELYRQEQRHHNLTTIIIIAIGLMVVLVFLVAWFGTRSYTLTIDRGQSLVSALNDRYFPANGRKARTVYLKSVAIAERCGIPLYERPLGAPSATRIGNYTVARRMADSTDWTLVRAPMFAGDVVKVRLFGGATCTPPPAPTRCASGYGVVFSTPTRPHITGGALSNSGYLI